MTDANDVVATLEAQGVDLSPTMVQAVELAAEEGVLIRRSGGYWTPPDEPMKRDKRGPEAGRHRSARTQTVRALRRRDVLSGDAWHEPARLQVDTGNRGAS